MSKLVDDFFAAVSTMTGDGPIKHRLIKAFEENLQTVEDGNLPPSARKSFAELRRMMKNVAPLNGEGPIRATVRKMSVRDAELCSQLMLDMLVELIRHIDSGQKPLPLQVGERPLVPPFLVKSG
ncbi:MAG: hypothetical protein ACREQ8_04720 [Woeseiaceae bacterium]